MWSTKVPLPLCAVVVIVACTGMTSSAGAQLAAYDFEDRLARVATSGAISRMVGWEFTLSSPITVTDLGYFDAGNTSPTNPPDGLFRSYAMGLWRVDGTLLTQGTVQSGTGSPVFQSYRYADVPDVALQAGQNYVVAGFLPEGNYSSQTYDPYPDFGSDWIFPLPGGGIEVRQPNVDYAAGVTLVGSRFTLNNTSLVFPQQAFAGDNLVGAANFRFTPVPEPTALLGLVMAISITTARRRFLVRGDAQHKLDAAMQKRSGLPSALP